MCGLKKGFPQYFHQFHSFATASREQTKKIDLLGAKNVFSLFSRHTKNHMEIHEIINYQMKYEILWRIDDMR